MRKKNQKKKKDTNDINLDTKSLLLHESENIRPEKNTRKEAQAKFLCTFCRNNSL